MKLNRLEFLLMNNPVRAFIQEKYELPILMRMLGQRRFDSILEIGCGCGNGTRLIKKHFNPARIAAIDLDERMVRIARKTRKDESVVFRVMDAAEMDFPDASFDAVFDFGIIHHIPNWRDCIAEVKRVLKSNGRLVLEELSIDSFTGFPGGVWRLFLAHPYAEMFSTDEFVGRLEEAGFAIEGVQRLNPLGMVRHFSLVASL